MTDVDTSGEAVGRSITILMGWLTGPDSGQNDGLITAANQLAALVAERAMLSDPNAVHVNMLRGSIAKPSLGQIMHLYPEISAERDALTQSVARLHEKADDALRRRDEKARGLADAVAERDRMRAASLSDDDIDALQLTRTAASLALNSDIVHQSVKARVSDAIEHTTAIIARAALNGGTHG